MPDASHRQPQSDDPDIWKVYWHVKGMLWRTEPEIAAETQNELLQHLHENHEAPFNGYKVSRAIIEWLIAHHLAHSSDLSYGINLQGAIFDPKANLSELPLSNAIFKEANLEDAFLFEAHLEHADFTRANLTGAHLPHAHLDDALFIEARLDHALLDNASLVGANLGGASLKDATLSFANLTNAVLRSADLTGAFLDGTILQGADLDGAILIDATY